MASIFLDRQSGNWKVKTLDNGKDKRITLRKALPGEQPKPIPADVVRLAAQRGFVFSPETPKYIPDPLPTDGDDNGPDDLMGFLDYFLADYDQTHRLGSIKRMTGILNHYRRFLSTLDAPKLVSQVGESHIMAWFHWRLAQRDPRLKIAPKPHVIVGETEQLSGLLKLAVDKNKLPFNPCKRPLDKLRKAYPRPNPEDETKYLDPDERKEFLAKIDTAVNMGRVPQDYADLAKVMLATGIRVEAAVHMDYGWIGKDWLVKVPPTTDAVPTKTKTGYTTFVADIGQPVLTRRRGLQMAGRVFPEYMTQAMSYYYLRKLGITNHMLRHSFATALVDVEVPVQTICSLMGQKNIKTTMRYAKVREQAKMEAVAKLKLG